MELRLLNREIILEYLSGPTGTTMVLKCWGEAGRVSIGGTRGEQESPGTPLLVQRWKGPLAQGCGWPLEGKKTQFLELPQDRSPADTMISAQRESPQTSVPQK